MSEFNSKTVPQLKELLKEKSLSTEGKKADLVQRLTEAETATEEQPTVEEPVEEPKEEVKETEEVKVDSTKEEPEAAKEEEKPKVLTPEERKLLAIDLINKKIQRAEKFGDEAAAEAARKDLSRVEKFGVEQGTALAREIGIVDQALPSHKRKFNKFRKNNKNSFKKAGK